jgi:hypothetical protein
MHYSDNLLVYSTAPTCFDVHMSSSGSFFCSMLSYTKKFMQFFLVVYAGKPLHSLL